MLNMSFLLNFLTFAIEVKCLQTGHAQLEQYYNVADFWTYT